MRTDRLTHKQTNYFYMYRLAVGVANPPQAPRARKSLRAILVTRHCSYVPVSHL